ncbi:MAG: hypothetical protein ABSA91_19935 [Acidimicrobiales bacterium]
MPGSAWLLAFLVAGTAGPGTSMSAASPNAGVAQTRTGTALAPVGASFISSSRGYLLGDYACNGRPAGSSPCLALARTENGGTSWHFRPVPSVKFFWGLSAEAEHVPRSVSAIDFANAQDGYLYGPGLEVTSSDGGSWETAALGEVAELTTAEGYAYVLTTSSNEHGEQLPTLWRASLGSDAWSKVALPVTSAVYRLFSGDDEVLLLQLGADVGFNYPGPAGRIWLTTTDGDGWRAVASPCQPGLDGSAASLALSPDKPARWVVDCQLDRQSSQAMDVEHRIFVTTNAGRTWSSAGTAAPRGTDAALAWNGSDDFLLATQSAGDQTGARGGPSWRCPPSPAAFSMRS